MSIEDLPTDSKGAIPPPVHLRTDYGEQDENGVDLSLIRYMLSLTPLERAEAMARHALDSAMLYEYGRRHREAQSAKTG
jgi:hypothetical protein